MPISLPNGIEWDRLPGSTFKLLLVMRSNELTSRQLNRADLLNARSSLLRRTDDVSSAFESSLNLIKAALNLVVQEEFTEDDGAALGEVLMIIQDVMRAGYAQWRLEEKPPMRSPMVGVGAEASGDV